MKKNMIKMILDIVMIVILALLFNSHVAAMSFHEIAGLGVFGLFIIHCLLNIKWITAISKRFFSKSLAVKVRIGYIVNLLLAVTFIFVIISGISTSQVLFPADSHGSVWRGIHHFSGAISIILVGIHLGLHWSFVSGMFKKVVKIKEVIRKPIAIILLLVVLSFGVYSTVTSSFTSWLVEPFVTSVKDEGERIDHNTPTEPESDTDNQSTEETAEKSEDGKVGGDMNDHTPKEGENKAPHSSVPGNGGANKEHDDSTKTVDTNVFIFINTIAKFISIIGVFAAVTYYIEKLFMRKKKKSQ